MGKETRERESFVSPSNTENLSPQEDFSLSPPESSAVENRGISPASPTASVVQPSSEALSLKQIRARQRVMGNQEVRRQIDHQRDGAKLLSHHEAAHTSGADIIRRRFATMAADPTVDHIKKEKGAESATTSQDSSSQTTTGGSNGNTNAPTPSNTTTPTNQTTNTNGNAPSSSTTSAPTPENSTTPAAPTSTPTNSGNANGNNSATTQGNAPQGNGTAGNTTQNNTHTNAPNTSSTAAPSTTATGNGSRESGETTEENPTSGGGDGTDEGDGPRVGRRRGAGQTNATASSSSAGNHSSTHSAPSTSPAQQAKNTLRNLGTNGASGGPAAPETPNVQLPDEKDTPEPGSGNSNGIDQLQSNGPISTDLGPDIQLARDTQGTIQRTSDGGAGGGGAAAGGGGGAELLMPEPPEEASPESQARMEATQARMEQTTVNETDSMTPAEENVAHADAAVEEPETEQNARAEDQLVEALGERPAPSPQIEELCQRIYQVIRDRRPPDEDSLVDAQPAEMARAAGEELDSSVQGQVDNVEGAYDPMEQEQDGSPTREPQPVPDQPDAPQSPDVAASEAAPDPLDPAHTDLSADVAAQQSRREEAGMESETARMVEDPANPIVQAREGQEELEETAREAPEVVAQREQQAIQAAQTDMDAMQARALAAIQASRAGAVTDVTTRQSGAVQSQEQLRESIGRQANAIFDQAQTQVNDLMRDLPQTAMTRWETGVRSLSTNFENSLSRVREWIEERHSNVLNVVGDFFFGLPDWVTEEYDRAEQAFGDGVTTLLRDISSEVNSIVASAQAIIQSARDQINNLYNDLPAELQDWAAQERTQFGQRLDNLSTEVNTTRDNFERDLMQRASQAVQEARQQVHQLREEARGILGRIADAVNAFLEDPARFIINGLLQLVGIDPGAFWALVDRIGAAIDAIAEDPMNFANNLMEAVKQGFQLFFDNIGTHLLDGLLRWLFSRMGSVGVTAPTDFSLQSIITFFLQVMGISWTTIRRILARHLGEENIAMIEQAWDMISNLIEQGPEGIFNMIREQLDPTNILNMIMQTAIDYVVETLVQQVAIRIIGMLNPAGAVAQAIMAIYQVLRWIFENAAQIFSLVETIVNGITNIINGDIGGMAAAIERALAGILPVVIDFLAGLLSLGNLPERIADAVRGIQQWVEGVLDRIIGAVATRARALFQRMMGRDPNRPEAEAEGDESWRTQEHTFNDVDNSSHRLFFRQQGGQTVLMVASEPTPIREKLTEIQDDESESRTRRNHARTALGIYAEVDAIQERLNRRNLPATERQTQTQLMQTKLQALMTPLRRLDLDEGAPEPTHVTFNIGSKGRPRSVVAHPLTKIQGNTVGSEAQGSSTPMAGGDDLVDALNAANPREIWVRAHLLNARLHGPADARNLVAAPTLVNSRMSSQVETQAKEAVHDNDKTLHYETNVHGYYSGPVADQADTDEYPHSDQMEFIPTSLSTEWYEIEKENGNWQRVQGGDHGSSSWNIARPSVPRDTRALRSNLNNLGPDALASRAEISRSIAQNIVMERDANGFFSDPASFVSRMNQHYNNLIAARPNSTRLQDLKREHMPFIRRVSNENKVRIFT